jgi:hypothetical protein
LPTFERLPRFVRDYEHLSPTEQHAFKDAVRKFVDDLVAGGGFRKGPRVKGVQGAGGVFEMTWAEDGRATFQYGDARAGHEGEPHIVWRRVGTHDVFSAP